MRPDAFKSTINDNRPPAGIPETLVALWYDAKGEWDQAHEIAQEISGSNGDWIHAYLHRKEGDQANAAYWYNRAGKPFPADLSLDAEWDQLAVHFLAEKP